MLKNYFDYMKDIKQKCLRKFLVSFIVNYLNLFQGGRQCGPCPAGYTGNGQYCVQSASPCSMNPCHPMATCYDNPRK